jgi:glycosyltransferase involved in cell wall biosynthesis
MAWSRGVDAELFRPRPGADLGLPRPVFITVARLAVEKNLDAFLELDLPGSKMVVGDGPARADLARRFPGAVFLGTRMGEDLANAYAAADVFVFPSRTDTYGLVLLEALASGIPVAAYPVSGPRDVIGDAPVGALDEDLRAACLNALSLSREACRAFALDKTWHESARAFIANVRRAAAENKTVTELREARANA